MKVPMKKRDATRYYHLHQDIQHNTVYCREPKEFIQSLIDNDYIHEYISHHQRAQHSTTDEWHTLKDVPTQKITPVQMIP